MYGTSYQNTGGPLSQNQFQGGMRRLNDSRADDNSLFDMNDFPQLSVQSSSVRGPQGPLGNLLSCWRWMCFFWDFLNKSNICSFFPFVLCYEVSLRKQGPGANSVVQQSQEFSIQNEDFPALPGYKGFC